MEENKTTKTTEQQADELNLVLEDRKISVPVMNKLGEQIGVLRFDPTDVNMVRRYNEVADKFENALQNITTGGVEAFDEAGDKIIEFLDYVLDSDSRAAFFAKTHPLSPQNGKFYCEHVFETVGAFIELKFEAEGVKLNKRVSAQTHGYRTGKHAKGK